MQERPGMFSYEHVGDILTFIEGYNSALSEHNIKDKDAEHFSDFNKFVQKHYNIASTHANWAMMIRYNVSNGHASVNEFFEILNKFQCK